jgi:hypothetical protein
LEFSEIENFQVLVTNYYSECDIYNSLIQLWEISLDNVDPEISFLQLTQGLELFHKSFHQSDEGIRQSVFAEMKSHFKDFSGGKKWLQKMIYYHLLKIVQQININFPFPENSIDFLNKLTASRNYYTHYSNDLEAWNYHELLKINAILKLWLRCLLLNKLGVANESLQKVLKRELLYTRQTVIFENKYSMRFNNWFTR